MAKFYEIVQDIAEDVADALENAVQAAKKTLNAIKEVFETSGSQIEARKAERLAELNEVLSSVKALKQGIIDATHNTHVGTTQCCEKLDQTIDTLSKTIAYLDDPKNIIVKPHG